MGTFTISIIRAQKLAPRGQGGFADPAVRVYKGGKVEHLTKSVPHTLDPVWNEDVVLNLNAPFEQVTLEVTNVASAANAFMGKVDLHPHEFVNEEPKPVWYLLKRQNPDQHVSGDLYLKVTLLYHPKWETSLRGGYRLFKRLYAPAIEDLSEAIKEFHDTPDQLFELLEFRCTAYMGSKNFAAAKEDVLSMISLKKTHPSCFYFLGRVALAMEDYDQAYLAFTQGLDVNPGNARLNHALTSLRRNAQNQSIRKAMEDASKSLKSTQPEHAVELITEMLIKSDPNNYAFYWYRAIARLACNRYDLAEKDIRTCCEKNPNWPRQLPAKQGKMSKRGRINPAAQERYFYLQDRFLFYYKTNKAKDFQGFIILHGAQLDNQKRDLFIRTQGSSRIFSLNAPSTADATEWAEVLRRAAKLPLALPLEESMTSMAGSSKSGVEVPVNGAAALNVPASATSNPISVSPASSKLVSSSPLATTPSSSFGGAASNAPTVSYTQVVVSGISHEGWLYKAGEINTRFKKRWFVLRSEILYYFKGRPEAKDDVYSGVQGSIPITKYMIQRVPTPDFAFELLPHATGGRTYLLHASSEDERTRWIDEISLEIRRAHATLSCKETERASLEVSTDDECLHMTDSFTTSQPTRREAPEVRLFTPKSDLPEPNEADQSRPFERKTRPQSRYYGSYDASVNAGIINSRRSAGFHRASYLDSDTESGDEYSPLVKDYTYYDDSARSTEDSGSGESKGCCCSIM